MREDFDAVVVGAGPGGSATARALALDGASVLLLDRVPFPRDKACGDLLSPRALKALDELGVTLAGAQRSEAMALMGPRGTVARLPWPKGDYPGYAVTVPRLEFDAQLLASAQAAGAEFTVAGFDRLEQRDDDLLVVLEDGRAIRTPFLVGADGSLSKVAESAGLAASRRASTAGVWGFALRYYVDAVVERPLIAYWDEQPGRAFPGYGWLFPGANGQANLGMGISAARPEAAAQVQGVFPRFVAHLRDQGLLGDVELSPARRQGGWLRMGLADVAAARGRVLLVGDAAGLVNPLTGEGISAALTSGQAAAREILAGGDAAARYRAGLSRRHAPFYATAAGLNSAFIASPRLFSLTGRLLTAPGLGRVLGGGFSTWWNELLDGAAPGATRDVARSFVVLSRLVVSRSAVRRRVLAGLSSDPAAK